jgi:hypothetical protein
MTEIRIALTRFLIRMAIKTCTMGMTQDHLELALKWERKWY